MERISSFVFEPPRVRAGLLPKRMEHRAPALRSAGVARGARHPRNGSSARRLLAHSLGVRRLLFMFFASSQYLSCRRYDSRWSSASRIGRGQPRSRRPGAGRSRKARSLKPGAGAGAEPGRSPERKPDRKPDPERIPESSGSGTPTGFRSLQNPGFRREPVHSFSGLSVAARFLVVLSGSLVSFPRKRLSRASSSFGPAAEMDHGVGPSLGPPRRPRSRGRSRSSRRREREAVERPRGGPVADPSSLFSSSRRSRRGRSGNERPPPWIWGVLLEAPRPRAGGSWWRFCRVAALPGNRCRARPACDEGPRGRSGAFSLLGRRGRGGARTNQTRPRADGP